MAWYNEAEALAIEMNNILGTVLPEVKGESRIYKPSQLRGNLQKLFDFRLTIHAMTRNPMCDPNTGKIVALPAGRDGEMVKPEQSSSEEEKIIADFDKQDELICDTINKYNEKFRELATKNQMDLTNLYTQYNTIQEAVYTANEQVKKRKEEVEAEEREETGASTLTHRNKSIYQL